MHHGAGGPTWTDVGMYGGLALAAVQLTLVCVVLAAGLGTVGGHPRIAQARSAGSSAAVTFSGWSLRNRYQ